MMSTDLDIAVSARNAGFPTEQLKTAVMVALAESGGNEFATNHNTNGSTDYGLWQINSIHTDILKIGDWRKPLDNAKMAYLVYQKQGWNGWSAYKNESYKKFDSRASMAVNQLALILKIPDALGNAIQQDQQQPLAQFFTFVSDKHNWQRLGLIVVGAYLITLVFVSIARDTGVVEAGAKTIGAIKGLVL